MQRSARRDLERIGRKIGGNSVYDECHLDGASGELSPLRNGNRLSKKMAPAKTNTRRNIISLRELSVSA